MEVKGRPDSLYEASWTHWAARGLIWPGLPAF